MPGGAVWPAAVAAERERVEVGDRLAALEDQLLEGVSVEVDVALEVVELLPGRLCVDTQLFVSPGRGRWRGTLLLFVE